jgi:lysophospholipase L1-like esterase
MTLQWWPKIATCLASLLITLLLLELGIRLFAPQDLDFFNDEKIMRVSTKPGQSHEYIPYSRNDSLVGVPVRINSLGLRDAEIDVPKPPRTLRILAIGDSVTFGFGVRLEETYLKVLETQLNQHAQDGIRYEVVNAGVSGEGLLYYYHFLRSVVPTLEPDIILIGITLTKVGNYSDREGTVRPVMSRLNDIFLLVYQMNAFMRLNSHLYVSIYTNLKSIMYWTGILDINSINDYEYITLKQASEKQARVWESSLNLLAKIAILARDQEHPLVLVVFPMEVQLSPGALDLYRRKFGVSLGPEALQGEPQRRIRAFSSAQGIPIIDLLPTFQAAGEQELFLRNRSITYDPVHPSVLGHRLAGEEIYRVLTANGFLASPSRTILSGKNRRR